MCAQSEGRGFKSVDKTIERRVPSMLKVNLENKVALITGVADNLGANICLKLAEAGAEVWIHRFKEEDVKDMQNRILSFGSRVHMITNNLQTPEEVNKAIGRILERSGKIDILVNHAEDSSAGSLCDLTAEKWLQIFGCNLDVPFLCCQEVIPGMLQNGGGTIINISSQAAETGAIGPHYAATKSALDSFSKGLSREFNDRGIKVKVVTPPVQLHDESQTIETRTSVREAMANMTLLFCTSYTDYAIGDAIVVSGEVGS